MITNVSSEAIGTTIDNDGTLDKETTSYKDIFDAFRLALKFYHFRIKYRNRLDIIAAVLETTASGEVTRSNIYYKTFLAYERLRSYMSFLIEKELIEMSGYEDNRLYRATEKGIHFLQIYYSMRELLDQN
jgi:predicted transcriptional regulator